MSHVIVVLPHPVLHLNPSVCLSRDDVVTGREVWPIERNEPVTSVIVLSSIALMCRDLLSLPVTEGKRGRPALRCPVEMAPL